MVTYYIRVLFAALLSRARGWVLGNVVCLYCHLCFFVAFETHSQRGDCLFVWSPCLSRRVPLFARFVRVETSIFGILLLPWFCAVLWHFVFTCRFCTFVFCKVTGLLVFILNTSCLSWTPRAYFGFLELKTQIVVTHVCPRCFYISKIVGFDCPGYYSRLLARPAKAI